jgi:hypothetical protein
MFGAMFGTPGIGAKQSSTTNEFLWGGDVTRIHVLKIGRIVSGAIRDAGNTPTTDIRRGLIVGMLSASNELVEYDPAATDGSEIPVGILDVELLAVNLLTQADEKKFPPIVVSAPVKARKLFLNGAALVGHADEYIARKHLAALGFKFDDDLNGYKSGTVQRTQIKETDYTVVAADNGSLFQAKTADCTFTLPAIQVGLSFTFQQTANNEMSVASAEGDNVVVGNDLSADSITFTTDNEQIGAMVHVEGKYVDGVKKWVITLPHVPFGTGAATLTYAIAT